MSFPQFSGLSIALIQDDQPLDELLDPRAVMPPVVSVLPGACDLRIFNSTGGDIFADVSWGAAFYQTGIHVSNGATVDVPVPVEFFPFWHTIDVTARADGVSAFHGWPLATASLVRSPWQG